MRIRDWSPDVCSSDLSDRSDDIEHASHAPLANEGQGNGKHPAPEPRTAGLFDAESTSSPADTPVTAQHAGEGDTDTRQRHQDRKSARTGKSVSVSVDVGGRRIPKKKHTKQPNI